jgi:cytochrome c-type biogenesis protein CcmH
MPVHTMSQRQRLWMPIMVYLLLMGCVGLLGSAHAAVDVHQFDSPAQAAQYQGMIDELRCPKCQNQNLAGSDAPIAQDLKQRTYEMVKDGQTDQQIRDYMIDRYGDFISYRPPVRPSTWVLWFLPPVLLVLLFGGWLWHVWQRAKQRIRVASDVLSHAEQARLDQVLAARPVAPTPPAGDSHDV